MLETTATLQTVSQVAWSRICLVSRAITNGKKYSITYSGDSAYVEDLQD